MLKTFLLWFCDKTCPLEEVQWLFGCWVPAEYTVLWPSSGLISLIFDENFQNSQDDLIMWDHFILKSFLPFLLMDHLHQFLKHVYATWANRTNLRDLKKSSRQTALIRLFGFVCCNGVQCLWEKTPQPYHKRQLFADRISDNIFTKPTVLLTL